MTTTHHVDIPNDTSSKRRRRRGVVTIIGSVVAVVALLVIVSLAGHSNAPPPTVAAAAPAAVTSTATVIRTAPAPAPVTTTVKAAINSAACLAALDAGSDLDGYLGDVAGLAADGTKAAYNHDTAGMTLVTDEVSTLTTKIVTARAQLSSQSAQCRLDLDH